MYSVIVLWVPKKNSDEKLTDGQPKNIMIIMYQKLFLLP